MLETVYIARHGFRLNWVSSNWTSATGLPRDPPLASYGIDQSKELAKYFDSLPENKRPTAIYSSPYYRCLQTAAPTAATLRLPLFVEHGISEWYSPVEPGTGLHPRPSDAKALQKYFPDIDTSYRSLYIPTQLGEEVEAVHQRCRDFMQVFIPFVEATTKHERILLVSHAATVITLARALVGDTEMKSPMRVGTCSLTTVESKSKTVAEGDDLKTLGSDRWEITGLTDASFLTGGVERDWGFEDIQIRDGKVVNDRGVPGTEDHPDGPSGLQIDGIPDARM